VIVEVTASSRSLPAVLLSPFGGYNEKQMSQSLHAIKRFRLHELLIASPKTRIPPATTASASNQLQRPLASTPLAAQPPPPHLLTERSGSDVLATAGPSIVLNNPFVPHKNPKSGRWAPAKYSLRRQADLVKHARKSGTLHLLPPGPKMSETQLAAAEAAEAVAAVPAEQEREESVASGLVSVRREQGLGQEEEEEHGRGRGRGPVSEDAVAVDDVWATGSVEWVGTVRSRSVAGADVGNRLYAGKKRMFKGHKWERVRERRVARTKMLLRDMDKRVQRFKAYRAKGKPLPLARRSNMLKKTQKLPF